MKVLVLLIAVCLLLGGCVPKQEQPTVPTVPTEETQPQTTAETTVSPMAGLHSGLKPDGSFDEGTLFIGDSLTYGMVTKYLPDNGLLGEAKYMAVPGATITCYMQGAVLGVKPAVYSPEFEGLAMYQAVEQTGAQFRAVYLMLGTNANEYATDQIYIDMVAHLLENCPNATIYLQLVPYNQSDRVNSEAANARVQTAYDHFAGERRVLLIDTQTAIGYNLAPDGIHLVTKGQECWYQAIVDYANDSGIAQ